MAGSGTNPAAAIDFAGATLPTGTVSFAAGETSKTVTVNVAGDTTIEPNETFTLSLSNPSTGATITAASATGTILNDDAASPGFANSNIATTFSGGRLRTLEHDHSTKSVFVDGDWYSVLPDGGQWQVERFTGPVPAVGAQGGWTAVGGSNHLLDANRSSDIAWDASANNLYVLQFYDQSTKPAMTELHYNSVTHTFSETTQAQIAGLGGKLAGTSWSKNAELVIGMDQNNTPLVANIGTSTTFGDNRGLHLAWASKDLSTWGETMIDPDPTGAGGNSKADIVAYTQGGVQRVGIAYSDDTAGIHDDGSHGVWKFASHDASTNPADYATGWKIETFNSTVHVDNHLSVAWDGSNIFMAMKDDQNAVWLTKGVPGDWETVKVSDGGSGKSPSRPTLVIDQEDDRLLVFYQEHTDAPYGDIYMKSTSLDAAPSFDTASKGTLAYPPRPAVPWSIPSHRCIPSTPAWTTPSTCLPGTST